MAGGTIADRGYFALRLEDSMAKIGELDEEFVWERSLGDSFTLGAQSWQIRRITHNDVLVTPGRKSSAMAPFWRADAQDRGFYFSEKVACFLERAEDRLESPELARELVSEHAFEPAAAAELLELLRTQKASTGVLPHRHRLLAEWVQPRPEDREEHRRVIFHTFWGGRVNRPLAIALAAAWEEQHGETLEIVHDDDCLMVMLPRPMAAEEVLGLVDPEQVEALLRLRLETTGFFGARFRIAASTALLLPKSGFRNRTPLWLNRMRAKKLGEAVSRYGDFPVVVETWRTCLQDEFELDALKALLPTPLVDNRPQCGRLKHEQAEFLFGDQAAAIESCAVIPLGHCGSAGLLSIGSREVNRFNPCMGTLFLSHLGELIARLLERFNR